MTRTASGGTLPRRGEKKIDHSAEKNTADGYQNEDKDACESWNDMVLQEQNHWGTCTREVKQIISL